MQQASVIWVLYVFGVELPIRLRVLARAAQVHDRLMKDAVDPWPHLLADVIANGCGGIAERRKHQAAIIFDAQWPQGVGLWIKVRRHADHFFLPASKRHALQCAAGAVGPLVVYADMRHRIATRSAADHRTSMRAAIHPCGEFVIFGARDDNRCIPHECRLEVAGIGNFGFEREKAPGRSPKNPLLLAVVDLLRAINLERHSRSVRIGKAYEMIGNRSESRLHTSIHGHTPCRKAVAKQEDSTNAGGCAGAPSL